ncbi:glycosyltransferase family 2 protein [Actibacterium pelagium]|uniref:Glycosyltransferase 2-like domain-containing protein n=1 Tax=Actibacterium pelagium TaxID=2029103 RepID=A0A917AN19_9RHOB|nr:glycosyltransferase family 2 protein [Actibacterium pelagium]GGE62437.1 hypothetical protein GCM10011517_32680 [Actibacterium pelagium]
MPKASIVVPAFNCASTLPETLVSLRQQSFRDFEIVVIDDGSTDETPQIAQEHAQCDPRIRVVRQPNRGLAGARNSGIAEAKGEIIGFCDADDLWHPNKLANHVDHFDQSPHVGLSYSGSELIDEASQPTGHAQRPRLTGVTAAHVFKRNPIGNGSAPVFRRAALQSLAWRPRHERQRDWVFDETFRQSEDIECWLRFALTTDWVIEGIPGLLTGYRLNGGGLSANVDRQLETWERVVTKLRPLDPAFFAKHEDTARAYQLRYLARRAVRSSDASTAVTMVRKSMRSSTKPLLEEPLKTLTTWAAAHALARFGDAPLRRAQSLLRPMKTTQN